MNQNNFLKSFTTHDTQLLCAMTNMINTNPNARIIEASFNLIKVMGNDLEDFLDVVVSQVPVLDMKVSQVKNTKLNRNNPDCDIHCVFFTFHGVDKRRRMNNIMGDD